MTVRDVFVYRAYDGHGQLLYVGVTNNPKRRAREHSTSSNWYASVARCLLSGPYPRRTALALEREAHVTEAPLDGDTPARRSARAKSNSIMKKRLVHLIAAEGMPPQAAVAQVYAEMDEAAA